MKLLLHIGAAKTGTTAVQNYLALNRQQLLDEGVYLLDDSATGNNRALAACCTNENQFSAFFHYNRVPAEDREKYRKSYFRNLIVELDQLDSAIHTVITSSEDFYGGFLQEESIERLASYLKPVFDEIEVLIYIRPQLETLDSLYSTFLKTGQPLSYVKYVELYFSAASVVYNYDIGLRYWERGFGLDNMIVRIFKAQDMLNGDLFDDYMQFLLPDSSIELRRPNVRLNESLSPFGQRIMLATNRRIEAFSDEHGWNPNWKRLRDYFSVKFPGKGIAARVPIGHGDIVKMNDSNELVRLRYFPDRPRLFSA